jgi:dihydroorotate dehydrogenase electron transfer subunit
MISKFTSTTPVLHPDGTISAILRDRQPVPPAGVILRLWLPIAYHTGGGFGCFFLARCTEDTHEARRSEWSIYSRRALFCAAMPAAGPDGAEAGDAPLGSLWDLLVPAGDDPGHHWLARRQPESSINLLGPFGQPFALAAHARTLLVLTNAQRLPLTLPVIHTMLDRGGRVALLLQGEPDTAAPLLPLLPISVEVRIIQAEEWLAELAEPVRWADQLCAALPNEQYGELAHHIRTIRFQSDKAFAQVLVGSDLACGVGACLACVVTTREGGFTRACMHGPIFPLNAIAP